jgi:diketogulonate reductase-like aldo/keto reductase
LHWRAEVPFSETLAAFIELQRAGKIRYYGVSNLDLDEMKQLWPLAGAEAVQTNQLLYNLSRRSIERDLLPWLRRRRLPVMAYSPIDQARLAQAPKLIDFARRRGMTPAQAALSWLLNKQDVIVIPKTCRRQRLTENLGALDHPLSPPQLLELERLFPPPSARRPLEIL